MWEEQSSPIQVQLDTSQELTYDIQDGQQLLARYTQEFQQRMQKSFDESSLNREQEFRGLIKFIDLIATMIKNEPQLQDLFNLTFLKKLVKYTSSNNVFYARSAIILLDEVMQRKMIANRLFHQRGSERTVVDLVNSLLSLQQQLKHSTLELHIDELLGELQIEKDLSHLKQIETHLKQSLKNMVNHNDFIKSIQIALSSCDSIYQQYQLFSGSMQELIYEYLLMVKGDDKYTQLTQILAIYERYLFDVQYTIYMDTHNFKELKTYQLKVEKQMILSHMHKLYRTCAHLLNIILLIPNDVNLQKRTFYIIKVLFKYFPEQRDQMINPITLVLRNLSLFLPKDTTEFKEATIFLYQLIHSSEYDEKIKKKLSEDEDLVFLRECKQFSVKALSYVEETQTVPSLRNLNVQAVFPCFTLVQAASIYNYSFVVEKQNSLIYWSFRTLDFDICFGLFKLSLVEDLGINDYQNERNGVKCLIKLQRIESHKQPVIVNKQINNLLQGVTLITNPGLYRIVFDNSYSYLRSKQLFYSIHLLESK